MIVKDMKIKTGIILKQLANDNGGIIHAIIAEEAGVSRAMLSYLVKQGSLSRIAIGFKKTVNDKINYTIKIPGPRSTL